MLLPLTVKLPLLITAAAFSSRKNSVPLMLLLLPAASVSVRPSRIAVELPVSMRPWPPAAPTVSAPLPVTVPALHPMSVAVTLLLPASVPPVTVSSGVLTFAVFSVSVPPLTVSDPGAMPTLPGVKVAAPALTVSAPVRLYAPFVVNVAPLTVSAPAPARLPAALNVCVPALMSSVAPPATLNAPVCVPAVVNCTVPLLTFITPVLFTRSFVALKPKRVTPVPADFVSVPLLINPGKKLPSVWISNVPALVNTPPLIEPG